MQSNAYMLEALTFEGRVEDRPTRRFSHVRVLQVLVAKFLMMETCAPATLFRSHLSALGRRPMKQIKLSFVASKFEGVVFWIKAVGVR